MAKSHSTGAVWKPSLGAVPGPDGTTFRVWAPSAQQVMVSVQTAAGISIAVPLQTEPDGYFSGRVEAAHAGDRYQFCLGERGGFPDPASRFQPDGVHGPSEIIDPLSFQWTDQEWAGIASADQVVYELHVGTFSPEGSFEGVRERLAELKELGVTVIELLPVADFPGRWNWGYDGVSLFAPSRAYGRPDDLRRLVNEAHHLGLAVILDAVYNHLGPDGNYLGVYSPHYFTDRYHTPWGSAVNFDGEQSKDVRAMFLENALHWVHEYHFDGFRFDATHAIFDRSGKHILGELTDTIRAAAPDRRMITIAEDHRNLASMVKPTTEGGLGLDAVWADGFHHQVRRLLAGDTEGYFGDYTGTAADLATTIRKGWFYCGQFSKHLGEPRGTDPTGLPPRSFVHCIQNHDQVGNRPLGDRLNHVIDAAAYRTASALLLLSPSTPMLFMGQEWAASSPFQYFTDHHAELGALVTAGRRDEFKYFVSFSDPAQRERIPDPQSQSTFERSRLNWEERHTQPHLGTRILYRDLLRLRQAEPALRRTDREGFAVEAIGEHGLALRLGRPSERRLLIVIYLRGTPGTLTLESSDSWTPILTTEDDTYCSDPLPIATEATRGSLKLGFERFGVVVFATKRERGEGDDS